MDEKELIEGVSALLKEAGFAHLAKRSSSRSVTLSADKDNRSIVVHLADPEPAAGPRSSGSPQMLDLDSVRIRASMPGDLTTVASGSGAPAASKRKPASES
jgi:hypothetical protein